MFLDKLATFISRFCYINKLSYEAFAELCGMCEKSIGNIIRRETDIKLSTFEKLCKATNASPNELLLGSAPITIVIHSGQNNMPVVQHCPYCSGALLVFKQNFCHHCGHELVWADFIEPALLSSL